MENILQDAYKDVINFQNILLQYITNLIFQTHIFKLLVQVLHSQAQNLLFQQNHHFEFRYSKKFSLYLLS